MGGLQDEMDRLGHVKKAPRECWCDPSQKHKITDKCALHTKVFTSPQTKSCKCDTDKLFSFAPGPTRMLDKIDDRFTYNRISQQSRLKMFGDRDKDKALNIFDSYPSNPKKNRRHDKRWLANILK